MVGKEPLLKREGVKGPEGGGSSSHYTVAWRSTWRLDSFASTTHLMLELVALASFFMV